MKSKRPFLERVVSGYDIAVEPLPAIPLVEIMGSSRVLIENHNCIASYNSNEIIIDVKNGNITVVGEHLFLAQMTKERIVITGRIAGVQLNQRCQP